MGEKFLKEEEKKEDGNSLFPMKGEDEKYRKSERIKKKREIKEIFTQGEKIEGKGITLFHLSSPTRRIGIIITKTIKKAILRNKVRRRLRDIYRRNKVNFIGKTLIIASTPAEEMEYKRLEEEVLSLLKKLTPP